MSPILLERQLARGCLDLVGGQYSYWLSGKGTLVIICVSARITSCNCNVAIEYGKDYFLDEEGEENISTLIINLNLEKMSILILDCSIMLLMMR